MDQPLTGIGNYHNNDVLCGKTKLSHTHPGNIYFRSIIKKLRIEYISVPKTLKKSFAELVVFKIRSMQPPGRFLKRSEETGLWHEIDFHQALFKTRQALREGGPTIEKGIEKGEIRVKTNFLNTGEVHEVYTDEELDRRSGASSLAPSESSSCKRKYDSILTSPCVKRSRKNTDDNKRMDKLGGKRIRGGEIDPMPIQQIMRCNSIKDTEPSNDNNRRDKMGRNAIADKKIEPIPLQQIVRCDSASSPIAAAMRNFFTNYTLACEISPMLNASLSPYSGECSAQQNNYNDDQGTTSPKKEAQNEPQHWPLWRSPLAQKIDLPENRGTLRSSNIDLSTSEGPLGNENVHKRNDENLLDPYFTMDTKSTGTSYTSYEKYNSYYDSVGDGRPGNVFVEGNVQNTFSQQELPYNNYHDLEIDPSMSNDTTVASGLEKRFFSAQPSSSFSPTTGGDKTNRIA